MLFNSFNFIVFLLIFLPTFFFIPKKYKPLFLLLSSYVFYSFWSWKLLSLIVFSTLTDFYCAKAIYRHSDPAKRKAFLLLSCMVNLGVLALFKYANFFIENFNQLFSKFETSIHFNYLELPLVVGISFYTFQTLGYTIDVYRKTKTPEDNLINFATFVTFFPQLVAGPIEKAATLLPQIKKKSQFNAHQFNTGLQLMLWGFFKKCVVADRLSIFVDHMYDDPSAATSAQILMAVIFFSFQIYADFSGYCDIAIGLSRCIGINLSRNFNQPYIAASICEFWKRWHITLTCWFRDYVYISLGGNRLGYKRTLLNVFIVFLLSGLWHGAAWMFVVWAMIHVLIYIVELTFTKIFSDKFDKVLNIPIVYAIRILLTFSIVSSAWIFFRSESMTEAMAVFKGLLLFTSEVKGLELNMFELTIACVAIAVMLMTEYVHSKTALWLRWRATSVFVRWPVYYSVIFSILLFGEFQLKPFIYFQF